MRNLHTALICILTLILLVRCGTTRSAGKYGEYTKKKVYSQKIPENKIGVAIYLYDLQSKEELMVSDLKKLPGNVIDSSENFKLIVFDRDSVPRNIHIEKPGKTSLLLYPEHKKSKKNLIIFNVFMGPDLKGIL